MAANAPKAIVSSCESNITTAQVEREGDMMWSDFLSDVETFTAIPRDPDAHTNILFSSGTTGEPKAIPWTHTTPIKCAADAYLHHDIHPGNVLAWYTNLGWMMDRGSFMPVSSTKQPLPCMTACRPDATLGSLCRRRRSVCSGSCLPSSGRGRIQTACMDSTGTRSERSVQRVNAPILKRCYI